MIKAYLQQIMKELGIAYKGKVIVTDQNYLTSKAKILYTHTSPPFKDFINEALKNSCNLTSGALLKHVAALMTKQEGSDEIGAQILTEFLEKKGINARQFKIKDGSGESRYNLISPKTMTAILESIYADKNFSELIIDAMPNYGRWHTAL